PGPGQLDMRQVNADADQVQDAGQRHENDRRDHAAEDQADHDHDRRPLDPPRDAGAARALVAPPPVVLARLLAWFAAPYIRVAVPHVGVAMPSDRVGPPVNRVTTRRAPVASPPARMSPERALIAALPGVEASRPRPRRRQRPGLAPRATVDARPLRICVRG